MKNLFITSIMAIVFIFTMHAQETQFGIKVGFNVATLTETEDISGLDSRTAFHFGALAEFSISEVISIQPELIYSAQGADAEDDLLKLDYLYLPIMLKYYAAQGLSFEAGPQIGLLLSAKSEIDDEGDIKDELNEFDFGINFGLGYKMETGLNFGVRYCLGLANVYNVLDFFYYDGYKARNGVFQLYVGYNFN